MSERLDAFKVGDVVRVVAPSASRRPGTVTRIRVIEGAGTSVEVEFKGSEWFYPYRSWFSDEELTEETP